MKLIRQLAAPTRRARAWRRLVASLVAVLSLSGIAVAVTAAPASALPPECGGPQFGPYWWASVSATAASGSNKVLDVSSTGRSIIWTYNSADQQQHWYLYRCYYIVDDVRPYVFRSSADTSKCLGGSYGTGWSAGWLVDCSSSQVWIFRQLSSGSYNGQSAYVFRDWPNETRCLDVFDNGSANGVAVGLFPCNGGNNQRWF